MLLFKGAGMFVIKVTGYWGECFVSKTHEPCFKQKHARLFKTRQAAGSYIVKHFKQWDNVMDGSSTMNIREV